MNKTIGLFLMNRKGFLVLESLVKNNRKKLISFVQSRKDINKLIIIHDSLLPRYRGFAPLVNALINGEKTLGVTALIASESYDRGDILMQESINVHYPVKINVIIEKVAELYIKCVKNLLDLIISGKKLQPVKQNESNATYSIWRDSEDYFIDWSWPADKIKRFVDAVGFPYQGAVTWLEDKLIKVQDCDVIDDFKAETIHPGKVVFFENEMPVVICGEKALRINKMTLDNQDYRITRLKSRFR